MKATIKPLSGDQGLTFQPHALQIVLYGPFTYEPTIMCGSLVVTNCVLTFLILYSNKEFNDFLYTKMISNRTLEIIFYFQESCNSTD